MPAPVSTQAPRKVTASVHADKGGATRTDANDPAHDGLTPQQLNNSLKDQYDHGAKDLVIKLLTGAFDEFVEGDSVVSKHFLRQQSDVKFTAAKREFLDGLKEPIKDLALDIVDSAIYQGFNTAADGLVSTAQRDKTHDLLDEASKAFLANLLPDGGLDAAHAAVAKLNLMRRLSEHLDRHLIPRIKALEEQHVDARQGENPGQPANTLPSKIFQLPPAVAKQLQFSLATVDDDEYRHSLANVLEWIEQAGSRPVIELLRTHKIQDGFDAVDVLRQKGIGLPETLKLLIFLGLPETLKLLALLGPPPILDIDGKATTVDEKKYRLILTNVAEWYVRVGPDAIKELLESPQKPVFLQLLSMPNEIGTFNAGQYCFQNGMLLPEIVGLLKNLGTPEAFQQLCMAVLDTNPGRIWKREFGYWDELYAYTRDIARLKKLVLPATSLQEIVGFWRRVENKLGDAADRLSRVRSDLEHLRDYYPNESDGEIMFSVDYDMGVLKRYKMEYPELDLQTARNRFTELVDGLLERLGVKSDERPNILSKYDSWVKSQEVRKVMEHYDLHKNDAMRNFRTLMAIITLANSAPGASLDEVARSLRKKLRNE